MPHIGVWLSKKYYKKWKALGIPAGKLLREIIDIKCKERGIEVEDDCPELILRVKCPYCGHEQNTTTVRIVRCMNCNRSYQVYRKTGTSRIVGIVKGTMEMLHKKYYEVYGKSH